MAIKTKYLLRINEDLKLYMSRRARLNDRSLNQELNYRLRLSKSLDKLCTELNTTSKNNNHADTSHAINSILKLLSSYDISDVTDLNQGADAA